MYTVFYAKQKITSFSKLADAMDYVADEEAYWPLWEEILDPQGATGDARDILNQTKQFRMGWRHGRWFILG